MAANLKYIWLFLLLNCLVVISRTSKYGEDFCLISRIDVVPCNILDRGVSLPGKNQYAIYHTNFYTNNGPGFIKCELKEDHQVLNIASFGSNIMAIYSPGFTYQQEYGNQMFVDYNIHCGKGQFAYVNITTLQLQGRNCRDPNRNNRRVCVDYLRLENGYGATEVCGRNAARLRNRVEASDSFRMIFRTSWDVTDKGFEGRVFCFNHEMANQPGCTGGRGRENRNNEALPDTSMNPVKRQTRRFQHTLESIGEEREFVEDVSSIISRRRETVKIPYGVYAIYTDKKLMFYDKYTEENLPERTVVEIRTFNTDELVFYGVARDRHEEYIQFHGPADILVTGTYARLQKLEYDLESFIPTPREAEILSDMVQPFFQSVRETTEIPEELLYPPPIIHERPDDGPTLSTPRPTLSTPSLPPIRLPEEVEADIGLPRLPSPPRQKREGQKREVETYFTDHSILLALDNENACNPVLRSSSQTVIYRMEITDPVRLTTLRKFHERRRPE